ncbi:MAG: galactokinase family protein [Planctomycetota bacterium]
MTVQFVSITLAGGLGTRMPPDMPPKSCCRIGPVSVIENALAAYELAGIHSHVVVVGARAALVMEEVSRIRRDVLFAYQSAPRGTGDAVACALDLLERTLRPEHVLISAGDKVVEPAVIRSMVETYSSSPCDLCLLAGPLQNNPEGGRVIARDGKVLAIIESADLRALDLAAALRSLPGSERPRTVAQLRAFVSARLQAKKLPSFSQELATLLESPDDLPVPWDDLLHALAPLPERFSLSRNCGIVSLEEAKACDLVNLSLYIGRFDLLTDAVRRLKPSRARGTELYFTDVVEDLASRNSPVGLLRAADPTDVMAFNTLAELDEVRRIHAARVRTRTPYPDLATWERRFAHRRPNSLAHLAARLLSERIGPDRAAILVHSPGRINIMGRHVDHQGGACNLMAINREVVMAASPRPDDRINLWNLDEARYPSRSFSVRELTADIVWEDWLRTLDSQYLRRLASKSAGDWANYVKGAALRLQHHFKDRALLGMDAFVCGNIPVGAGLSSSSALVVAATEALVELNALNVLPRELVDLCGEGEWFVGTRGGSADHAAIKLGREKEVVTVSFFPFQVTGRHPFPEDHSLMVCHSGLSAKKTENAAARFNARVACYHMAREIIKAEFPSLAPRIEHLRDVNTTRLDVSLGALYRLLKRVPLTLATDDVLDLAARHPTVANCLTGLDLDKLARRGGLDFPLRDAALFCLAEIERARRAGKLLDRADVRAFGVTMNVSHDGDRVARWKGDCIPYSQSATDEYLDSLIARVEEPVPLSESLAALWQQPGGYGCSTPEIDFLVDRALTAPGVLGAQLAGAGLGGCIMVLLESDAAGDLEELLTNSYYIPQSVEPQLFVCQPSTGSQVLTSLETTGYN